MPSAAQRRFFLTKPTNYRIEYSINPWMDPKNQVDKARAESQWNSLRIEYQKLGAQVEVLEPADGWPDAVFTGDSIFLYGKHAIAGRFRYPERSGEVEPMVNLFALRGFTIHTLPGNLFFEGNGEAIAWNDVILAGYGVRSDREALDFIGETLGVRVVPIRVLPPHFHADTVVAPLNGDTLAIVPSGMDEESLERVHQLGVKLIEIDQDEGLKLACNSMALEKNVIVSTTNAPKFHKTLEASGFTVIPLELSEFAKSGGGAKCLTLEAYAA